jgi:ABC-type branched-subunit amino acid transport system ATPase component
MPTSSDDDRVGRAHLQLADVAAGYGSAPVIQDVTLTVGMGEIVTVIGPNGAGKSTLLKTVLGILRPSQGTITLAGSQIGGLATNQVSRRGVGYVPQVKDVFEPLTVKENLEIGGYALPRRAVAGRISEVLDQYPELAAMRNRPAGYLSGGERKLLAMARVLMRRPSLLVLDEPTAGLAPQLAHDLLTMHVAGLAGGGAAVLLVEQHAHEALAIAGWAYVMAAGRVRLHDAAPALLARPDLGDIFLGLADGPAAPSAGRS